MRKTTDLDAVKSVALAFLHLPIEETEMYPIVIMHPIFESAFISAKIDGKFSVINITESDENLQKAKTIWEDNIKRCDTLVQVYSLIRKSYRLTFLKFVEQYLSKQDMSEMLADAWVSSENPNQDTNCSLALLTRWFKKANKKALMTEEDYAVYDGLKPEFKVYRGVAVGRNPHGLSWTMNYEKAEWFANRFNTPDKKGYVQEVTITKAEALAYFNTRDEQEVVVDTAKIKSKIQKV